MLTRELPQSSLPEKLEPALIGELIAIIEGERLTPVFQPIVDFSTSSIIGYEGLIRGPASSRLYSPQDLFEVAGRCNMTQALERTCFAAVLERFVELDLKGSLSINLGPDTVQTESFHPDRLVPQLLKQGLSPQRLIVELTESRPFGQFETLRNRLHAYRQQGLRVALDDLGEGFSNLRSWAEISPDFVKLDKFFIQNIDENPIHRHFLTSIIQLAEHNGCHVVAEGVETQAEYQTLRDLGVNFGQGYFFGKPSALPARQFQIRHHQHSPFGQQESNLMIVTADRAGDLLVAVDTLASHAPADTAYRLFAEDADLFAIPVVDDGRPVGLLRRHHVLETFARPFSRELYAKKPCAGMMDPKPLIVDASMSIQTLSSIVVAAERRYLIDGFIITDQGRYLGMGTGFDLMKKINEIQIRAARHANPLTGLPGNVPINEAIDQELLTGRLFTVAYCDLDHFKPFNDLYGFSQGDELIQFTGHLLLEHADPNQDFVGHVGGDDFIVLFRSDDWEARCRGILAAFEQQVKRFFRPEHLDLGGFLAVQRNGESAFLPLTALSIGAIRIEPTLYHSHRDISAVAAEAKKVAKKTSGCSLFIERRQPELGGKLS